MNRPQIQFLQVEFLFFNWDLPTGNLESRTDLKTPNFESFTYDNLNRLRTSEVTTGQVEETDYYANGNIKTKSRIGSYTYDDGKLNAVEQVGNPAGDISLNTQAITYTPFNKCSTITENNNVLALIYGPDQQRRISELKNNGTTTKKIIYSGNYEKITDENGDVYEVHYLGFEAINVRKNGKPSSDQVFFAYTDHLGSIVKITNASATPIYEQNFDAWGRKRDPQDWDYDFNDYSPLSIPPGTHDPDKWLIRGFTGHEQLDEFALINMNGRVYDPLLGRMNSPDNFVQNPFGTQGYNRYSYANNNPLRYIDPSGDDPWDLLFRGFRFMNEGVNYAEQRANGNAGYSYDMHYAGTGQLPNDWRNNPNVVLGPNGYPMGPNGEYSSNDLFGGEVLPEYETAYETYLWGHWYTRFPDVPSQAPRRDSPIYKKRAVLVPVESGSGSGWVGPANAWMGGVGELAGAVKDLSGKTRVGSNFKLYTPTTSGRVFGGNQYVSTLKAAQVGKILGYTTLVVGTALDVKGVYNYYNYGVNDPNAVHPGEAGSNLGIGLWGLINPASATGAAIYYGVDTFYPGGFGGAMQNNANLIQQNQQIRTNFNLYRDW